MQYKINVETNFNTVLLFLYHILYCLIYRNKYSGGTRAKVTLKSQMCFVTS